STRARPRVRSLWRAPPVGGVSTIFAMRRHHDRIAAADRVVREPQVAQQTRVVEVASVEDHRGLELSLDVLEARAPKLSPFRHDRERVGAVQRLVGALAENQVRALAVDLARLLFGYRIVGANAAARCPERLHER